MKLRDTCPLAAEIIDGNHDADLQYVAEAAAQRLKWVMKNQFRRGSRVRLTAEARELEGREAIVDAVNQKTITVNLVCPACGNADPAKYLRAMEVAQGKRVSGGAEVVPWPAPECATCQDTCVSYRVTPGLIEAVAEPGEGSR